MKVAMRFISVSFQKIPTGGDMFALISVITIQLLLRPNLAPTGLIRTQTVSSMQFPKAANQD